MVADPTDPSHGMILQGFGISQRFWQESGYSLVAGGGGKKLGSLEGAIRIGAKSR